MAATNGFALADGIDACHARGELMIKIDFRKFFSNHMIFGFYVQCWPQPGAFGSCYWAAVSIGWTWNFHMLDDRKVPWHRCYDMRPFYAKYR